MISKILYLSGKARGSKGLEDVIRSLRSMASVILESTYYKRKDQGY